MFLARQALAQREGKEEGGTAAGAMIFVVIEEVVPEAQRGGNTDLATTGGMVGFAVMMLLDVAFG